MVMGLSMLITYNDNLRYSLIPHRILFYCYSIFYLYGKIKDKIAGETICFSAKYPEREGLS